MATRLFTDVSGRPPVKGQWTAQPCRPWSRFSAAGARKAERRSFYLHRSCSEGDPRLRSCVFGSPESLCSLGSAAGAGGPRGDLNPVSECLYHLRAGTMGVRELVGSPETGGTHRCEPPCGCREPDLCPPQDQQWLLTLCLIPNTNLVAHRPL